MTTFPLRLFALSLPPLLVVAPVRADDFFTSRVRPILASACFKCHGPDDATRKAKLRLDVREEALKPARSRKRAVVPGKPAESELVARIFTDDETEVMPPPATKLVLTKEQKEVLKRWVQEGAEYTTHWSFVPPKRHAVPPVKDAGWPHNPIDRFVLARLEKEGLRPSPQADRYALVRRVSLDLTGLPPTVAEADAFVHDERPGAYERLVDRLLASPSYGERWARRWLDLARYADTNGYEKDRPRSIWPYRDWVIGSLNADLPFDRFTVEQLAGDLQPGATREQVIATGFHRNTMLNEEGGIDPLEFRFHAMADRVATTGTVWLGLATACAQCHSHKYDPISQKDYYRIFAYLNNADEPELEIHDEAAKARRGEIDRLEADLPNRLDGEQEGQFQRWLDEQRKKAVRWTALRPAEARGSLPLLTVQPDDSVFVTGDQSKSDTYDLTFRGDWKGITAIRLEALPDPRLPRRGPGRIYYEGPPGDFFLSELSLTADGQKVKLKDATQSHAKDGNTAQKALDGDQQSGWSIDGAQGKAHQAVFRFDRPLAAHELRLKMLFERYYAAGLGRFRVWVTGDPRPAGASDLPTELEPPLLIEADKVTPEQTAALRRHFALTSSHTKKLREPIEQLRKQLGRPTTTLVFTERPPENPRPTFVHHRGEFLQPGERIQPGLPAALSDGAAPRDRLGFARWLASPANPLVGRVTVNRNWATLFGTGLVATVQDFGLQGEMPSHPELLDWLALEFMEGGWSMKRLHRLIVTSATYRQSSRTTPELLARDPGNRLLARGPRVRLEAEMVRDLTLRAGGLLAMGLGGPSVFPPQPPEVTTEGAYGRLDWRVSEGRDRHRRGLYTFMKRTAPFALFSTFDGPSGEVCLARRESSNTPLQALTMLNDQTVLEASRSLGRRLAGDKAEVESRVSQAFRAVLTRPPTPGELAMLTRFHSAQRERFARKELDAAAVGGPGATDEQAAWTALARVLFNLDETVVKR
ncbi:MAG: PSD1 and planctomycete cytochrome C domain-containing protein [Gemmataceae bacterium]